MTPDRYEVLPEGRQRLTGFIKKRGSRQGLSPIGGFLFGGLFVIVGVAISLVGLRFLKVDPHSVHAPDWVLTVFGAIFAFAGLSVWSLSLKQLAANHRRAEAILRHPNETALADYAWHPDGFAISEWPILGKALVMATAITIFLSIFNWWAFVQKGPWPVKIIVSLFDLVAVALWWQAVAQFGRALKFGHSRIDYASFPCRPPGPFNLRWQSFGGIHQLNHGAFTLRCVEEWTETSGTGDNRTTIVIHEQIWAARWLLEKPRNLQLQEKIELRFELPADARSTQLNADRPIFWELEVKLDLPGLDFAETYLVPVYASSSTLAPAIQNQVKANT